MCFQYLVATEMLVCYSWKHHLNDQHDRTIQELQHYFSQVVSGVSIRNYQYIFLK